MFGLFKSVMTPVALVIGMQLTGSANAQTEVARVPWALLGTTQCDMAALVCRVFFPQVGASRRFDIEHVSCYATTGGELDAARLAVDDATNLNAAHHYLLWTSSTFAGQTKLSLSEAISFSIPGGRRPQIAIPYNIHLPTGTKCTLSGELVFLQPS